MVHSMASFKSNAWNRATFLLNFDSRYLRHRYNLSLAQRWQHPEILNVPCFHFPAALLFQMLLSDPELTVLVVLSGFHLVWITDQINHLVVMVVSSHCMIRDRPFSIRRRDVLLAASFGMQLHIGIHVTCSPIAKAHDLDYFEPTQEFFLSFISYNINPAKIVLQNFLVLQNEPSLYDTWVRQIILMLQLFSCVFEKKNMV